MIYSTNSIKFVYCFTKKLASNKKEYKVNLTLFKKSVELLSKHYSYRVVTDKETLKDISPFVTNYSLVDSTDFHFVDDFKIDELGKLLVNEVLIDPDVLIYKPLEYSLNEDLIFDYIDNPSREWYTSNISKLDNTLLGDKINLSNTPKFIPNIGLLKINNRKLLNEYLNQYKLYRNNILKNVTSGTRGLSIMLGQFLLGLLLFNENYSYLSIRSLNRGDVYVHLGGPQKYKTQKNNKSVI